MPGIIKINAPQVLSVPANDNGEKLIDLLKDFPNLKVDITRRYSQKLSNSISHLRKGVAEKLLSAEQYLPEGTRFLIIEGYRPISVQKILFESYLKRLKKEHPELDDKKLKELAVEFVAPPDVNPPHSTGGSVDLTLIDKNRKALDMGTDLNDSYTKDVYTYSPNISKQAKKNRQILINALEKEGFVNYPAEWWHWSYGDRYWAFTKKEPFALYDSVC